MSNEIQRWAAGGSGGWLQKRQDKEQTRAVEHLKRETSFAGIKVDAEAALTARVMERAVDIDTYRRALAGNDETLNSVLVRIELGFVSKAERIQRGFGSEFPL